MSDVSSFLSLSWFKTVLQITDTQDDNLLLQFVNNANRKIQTDLSPFIDTPILPGSPFFSRCGDAALFYARSLHAEDIEQIEKSNNYLKKYNIEMFGLDEEHGLVQELKALRTSRTRTVMITSDPREIKVPMPTLNLNYVFDQFS